MTTACHTWDLCFMKRSEDSVRDPSNWRSCGMWQEPESGITSIVVKVLEKRLIITLTIHKLYL